MAYDAGFANGLVSQAASATAGYLTLGTRNLARAQRFYDVIAHEIGVRRAVESDDATAWGLPGFGLAVSAAAPMPAQGLAPLQAEDPGQVERLFELALANGGSAEAAPADHGGFYAAYFRDPDGNRLNAFCVTQH
jgi:catechol 2,3-dioxygenase-like lactoylglutathione lyase family enzyme